MDAIGAVGKDDVAFALEKAVEGVTSLPAERSERVELGIAARLVETRHVGTEATPHFDCARRVRRRGAEDRFAPEDATPGVGTFCARPLFLEPHGVCELCGPLVFRKRLEAIRPLDPERDLL